MKEDETPKQYLSRFKQLESKIKKAKTTISPQYLGHHFLERANLDHLMIQSILPMADLDSDEEVLKHIQKEYEEIFMEKEDKKTFYGSGYQTRSHSLMSREPREPPREFRDSCEEERCSKPRFRSVSPNQGRFRSQSQSRRRC